MRNSLTPSASWNTFCRLVQQLFGEILTDIKSKFYYLRRLTYRLVLRVEVYQGESTASARLTRRIFITRAFIFATRVGVLNSIATTGAAGETTHIIKFPQWILVELYLNTVTVQLQLVGTAWDWAKRKVLRRCVLVANFSLFCWVCTVFSLAGSSVMSDKTAVRNYANGSLKTVWVCFFRMAITGCHNKNFLHN